MKDSTKAFTSRGDNSTIFAREKRPKYFLQFKGSRLTDTFGDF